MNIRIVSMLLFLLVLAAGASPVGASGYDPLAVDESLESITRFISFTYGKQDREIPLRIYLPDTDREAPVVLFSHGLGGSRNGSAYLGRHWAARGYLCVFLQHPGSDDSIYKDVPRDERYKAMTKAAGSKQFINRTKDVPATLDQLKRWNNKKGHLLYRRMDLDKVGMSGHSFGAVTTQAVCGQSYMGGSRDYTDQRIDAALPMSPSPPSVGRLENAFKHVKIPWMVMTGTEDNSPHHNITALDRRKVFPALPPGDKYELVLYGAEHNAFTAWSPPGKKDKRDPKHHERILALSTAYWDFYLKGDNAAGEWLKGEGAQSILGKKDGWRLSIS